MTQPTCRFCRAPLTRTFADLGTSPLCQEHVTPERFALGEVFYPLHARVCESCLLVQVDDVVPPDEIFGRGDYAYFSSYSESWLHHARVYCEAMQSRFGLGSQSRIVEIASNDGYLLQNFVSAGIPALGIEPASNCADAAREKGVETWVRFFGVETAEYVREEWGRADLLLGNNVLAHVPDLNDFVAGMKILLSEAGVITMEFPHLQRLAEQNQFDTIYHEHFSYLSFATVQRVFAAHGLTLFDVEELPTHGGSIRIYAQHAEYAARSIEASVAAMLQQESSAGMDTLVWYTRFGDQVAQTKRGILAFLIDAKARGRRVVGYGAPGKGNTLLNYCGIGTDMIDYTVDRSPHKQGNFLPGSRIPILAPEEIFKTQPDYLFILPWNLRAEIMDQMSGIREWGGQFVVPIPEIEVWE